MKKTLQAILASLTLTSPLSERHEIIESPVYLECSLDNYSTNSDYNGASITLVGHPFLPRRLRFIIHPKYSALA